MANGKNSKTLTADELNEIESLSEGNSNSGKSVSELKDRSSRSLSRGITDQELAALEGGEPETPTIGVTTGQSLQESQYTPGYIPGRDIEGLAAENQPGLDQFGNFLNQAVVGEIVGGSIEAAGYLTNVTEGVGTQESIRAGADNIIAEFGKSIRQWTQETTPIYKNYETGGEGGTFRPDKWSWWMSNGPAMASTLSLMIPSMAVTKGLKAASRISNIYKATEKAARAGMGTQNAAKAMRLAEAGGQAGLSRYMENMMESTRAFDENKKSWIEQGVSEQEATEKAAEAATNQFWSNSGLFLSDLAQYYAIGRTPRLASSTKSFKLARAAGRSGAKEIGRKSANIMGQMVSEGAEESWQYMSNEETAHMAEVDLGLKEPNNFTSRLFEYMGSGRFQTESFFGALGGGAFHALGPAVNKVGEKLTGAESEEARRIKFYRDKEKAISHLNKRAQEADEYDEAAGEAMRESINTEMSFRAAELGDIDLWKEWLEGLKGTNAEEHNSRNPDNPLSQEFIDKAPKYLEEADRIEKIYNDTTSQYPETPKVATQFARQKWLREKYGKDGEKIKQRIQELENNLPRTDELSQDGKRLFEIEKERRNKQRQKKVHEFHLKNEKTSTPEMDQKRVKALDDKIKELDKEKQEINQNSERTQEEVNTDNEIISGLDTQQELIKAHSQLAINNHYAEKARIRSEELAKDKNTAEENEKKANKRIDKNKKILETTGRVDEPISNGDLVEMDAQPYIYKGSRTKGDGSIEHQLAHYDNRNTKRIVPDDEFQQKAYKRKSQEQQTEEEVENANTEGVNQQSAEQQQTQGGPVLEETTLGETTQEQPQQIQNQRSNYLSEKEIRNLNGKEVDYKGTRGKITVDEGGKTEFETNDTIYELGNVSDIKLLRNRLSEVESEVKPIDSNTYQVRGKRYINRYSDITRAINFDENGNVISVDLETGDGGKRTFRGETGEDLAYQIMLAKLNEDNNARQEFTEEIESSVQEVQQNEQKPTVQSDEETLFKETQEGEPVEDVEELEEETTASEVNIGDTVTLETDKNGQGTIEEDRGDKFLVRKPDGTAAQVKKSNVTKEGEIPESAEEQEGEGNKVTSGKTKTKKIRGELSGQGTQIDIEIVGDTGKEFLLTINREGRVDLWSEKQSDGTYKPPLRPAPKKEIERLYKKYVPEKTRKAVDNWVNAFVNGWANPSTEEGKHYQKVEKELETELAALEDQPQQETSTSSYVQSKSQSTGIQPEIPNDNADENKAVLKNRSRTKEFPDSYLGDIMSMAWKSSENLYFKRQGLDQDERAKALSAFLEDPNTVLTGNQVRLDIDFDLMRQVVERTEDQKTQQEKERTPVYKRLLKSLESGQAPNEFDAGFAPVAIRMLGEDGSIVKIDNNGYPGTDGEYEILGYIHDTDYPYIKDDTEVERVRDVKEQVVKRYLDGQDSYSFIADKGGGVLNTDKSTGRIRTRLAGTPYDQYDNIKLAVSGQQNAYMADTKNVLEELKRFDTRDGSRGAVYMAVEQANGEPFPLRLSTDNIDRNTADVLYDAFGNLLDRAKPQENITDSIREKLLNNEGDQADAVRKILGLDENQNKTITYDDLINNVVYQGKNQTLGKDEKVLYFQGKNLYFGDDQVSRDRIQDENFRKRFINHVTNSKKFQVNLSRLNEDKYKKALIDHVLSTNIAADTERLFVQPNVIIDENIGDQTSGEVEGTEGIDIAEPEAKRNPDEEGKTETDKERSKRLLEEYQNKGGNSPLKGLTSLGESVQDNANYEVGNLPEMRDWIRRHVNVSTEVQQGLINVEGKGPIAHGMFANAVITLSDRAARGTEYHEAFHAVSELYLSDEYRDKLYDEAAKRFKIDRNNERTIEETLADAFQVYMENRRDAGITGRVREFFNQILELIRNVFGRPTVREQLFRQISRGHFSNSVRVTPETRRFTTGPLYKEKPFPAEEMEEWTNAITFIAVKNSGVTDFGNVNNLDFSTVRPALLDHWKEAYDAGYNQLADKFAYVLDNEQIFFDEAKNKLAELGVVEDSSREVTDENDMTGWENLKQAFTVSDKARMTDNIKLQIMLLPKKRFNDDGSVELVKGQYTGLPQFNDFNETWNFLKSNMAGLAPTEDTNGITEDGFKLMMDKLRELESSRPELRNLRTSLEQQPDHIQTQFYIAMQGTPHDHLFTNVVQKGSPKKGYTYDFKIGSATKQGIRNQVQNQWVENFRNKLIRQDGKLRSDEANKLAQKFNPNSDQSLRTRIKKNARKGGRNEDAYNKHLAELRDTLHETGITISNEGLRKAVADRKGDNKFDKLSDLITNPSTGLANIYYGEKGNNMYASQGTEMFTEEGKPKFPITDEKAINSLVDSEAMFSHLFSENMTIGPEGNPHYQFSEYGFTTYFIAELNRNPQKAREMLNDPYYKGSRFLEYIANNPGEFTHHTYNNYRLVRSNDRGTSYQNLPYPDDLADRINKTLRGYYHSVNPADSKTFHSFSGPPLMNGNINVAEDGTIEINSDEVVEQFKNYFMNELMRISKAYQDVFGDENIDPRDPSELIAFRHYKLDGNTPKFKENEDQDLSKDNRPTGRSFYFHHFTELNEVGGELARELGIYKENGRNYGQPFTPDPKLKDNPALDSYIRNKIREKIQTELDLVVDKEVITEQGGVYKNRAIDSGHLESYKRTRGESPAIVAAIGDYTINSMIGNIEQKIFTGDIANFKSNDDYDKRTNMPVSPKQSMRIYKNDLGGWEVRPNFNVSVIENIIKKSEFLDEIRRSLKATSSYSESEIEQIVEEYSNVNQTDAQGFITVDRWIEIKKGTGQWKPEFDEYIDDIKAGRMLPRDIPGMQPEKGQFHGLRTAPTGELVTTDLKYSQAVLFPALTKGTKLDNLRTAMENQQVDEAVVIDGVKTGIQSVNKVTDENNSILDAGEINLDNFQLSNKYWGLQQDLPSKGAHTDKEGSQIIKMLVGDVNLEESFPTDENENDTGRDVVKKIHRTESAMSNTSTQQMRNELDMLEGGFTIQDQERFRELIKNAVGRNRAPDEVYRMLDTGQPIEAMSPGYRRVIENRLAAEIRENNVRTKVLGGGFIQMSNFGYQPVKVENLTEGQKGKIKYLTKVEDLAPPRYNESTGEVESGQIFLPHPVWNELINHPANKDLSEEQLIEKINQSPEILEAITYRIPTQGYPSINKMEVVGILPEEVGDTVVAYTEITTKDGSDFDIDKMNVMIPYYEINENGDPSKIEFLTEETPPGRRYGVKYQEFKDTYRGRKIIEEVGEEAVQEEAIKRGFFPSFEAFKAYPIEDQNTLKALANRKIKLYSAIMNNPKSYAKMITPLENTNHKDIARDVEQLEGVQEEQLSGLELVSPKRQLDKKAEFMGAGAGVGQAANHLAGHTLSQISDLYFNKDLKMGHNDSEIGRTSLSAIEDVEGNLISSNLSGFVSGFVDIANDTWTNSVNANTFTNATIFLLNRAGVPNSIAMRLAPQPIIKEATQRNFDKQSAIASRDYINGVPVDAIEAVKNKYLEQLSDDSFEPKASNAKMDVQDLRSGIRNQMESEQDIKDQLNYLKLFKQMRQDAKYLTEEVNATKQDVNAMGKDVSEAIVIDNRVNKVREEGMIGNFNNKMKGTFLQTHHQNSVKFALDGFKGTFMTASETFRELSDLVAQRIGQYPLINQDIMDSVKNNAYSFLNSKFDLFNMSQTEMKELLFDTEESKSIPSRFTEALEKEEFANNPVSKILHTFTDTNGYRFLASNSQLRLEPYQVDDMKQRWLELINSDDAEISQLAKDMVKYSFITSGFNKNMNSFYEIMPIEYLNENGYDQFADSVITNPGTEQFNNFEEFYFKNNTENKQIVPSVPNQLAKKVEGISMDNMIAVDLGKAQNLITGQDKSGFPAMKPFVAFGSNNETYKHAGYRKVGEENTSEAIYMRTNKLGYSTGRQKVVEYRGDNNPNRSVISENNINRNDDNWKKAREFVDQLKQPEGVESNKKLETVQETSQETERQLDNPEKDIAGFYDGLTQEQQEKLGNMESIIEEYRNYPVQQTSANFIETLRNRLEC